MSKPLAQIVIHVPEDAALVVAVLRPRYLRPVVEARGEPVPERAPAAVIHLSERARKLAGGECG